MTPGERWLATPWPLVRTRLPAAPARMVEVGRGPLGGFVPMLRADGYDAVGIDPQAPDGGHYQRIEFERAELPQQVDAAARCCQLSQLAAALIPQLVRAHLLGLARWRAAPTRVGADESNSEPAKPPRIGLCPGSTTPNRARRSRAEA